MKFTTVCGECETISIELAGQPLLIQNNDDFGNEVWEIDLSNMYCPRNEDHREYYVDPVMEF